MLTRPWSAWLLLMGISMPVAGSAPRVFDLRAHRSIQRQLHALIDAQDWSLVKSEDIQLEALFFRYTVDPQATDIPLLIAALNAQAGADGCTMHAGSDMQRLRDMQPGMARSRILLDLLDIGSPDARCGARWYARPNEQWAWVSGRSGDPLTRTLQHPLVIDDDICDVLVELSDAISTPAQPVRSSCRYMDPNENFIRRTFNLRVDARAGDTLEASIASSLAEAEMILRASYYIDRHPDDVTLGILWRVHDVWFDD